MDDSTRNVRLFSYETFPHFEAIFSNWFPQETCIEACKDGRIDEARQLLRSGANVNATKLVRIIIDQLMFIFLFF